MQTCQSKKGFLSAQIGNNNNTEYCQNVLTVLVLSIDEVSEILDNGLGCNSVVRDSKLSWLIMKYYNMKDPILINLNQSDQRSISDKIDVVSQ